MGSEARTVSQSNLEEVTEWCKGKLVMEHDSLDHSVTNPGINLQTADGVKRAYVGDTIIRCDNGTYMIWKG